jgi:DNA-binding NtrC family response regulator
MYQRPVDHIEPDALAVMQSYPWPGNVRELENVMQRAIILSNGDTIRVSDLPATLQAQNVSAIDADLPVGSFERQLHDFKIKLATAAIEENHGNKTLAARRLCISRAYLHRLVRLAGPEASLHPEDMELETA